MVHMGLIAQEVEKLVKAKGYKLDLVHSPTNQTDNYSIAYGELITPVIKAIQEQQRLINDQKKQIDTLTERIKKLENK